jgi:hypothetical protein
MYGVPSLKTAGLINHHGHLRENVKYPICKNFNFIHKLLDAQFHVNGLRALARRAIRVYMFNKSRKTFLVLRLTWLEFKV